METTVPVLAGAEPFTAEGDGLGFLLCHGFTGSPQGLRPWAQHLAGAGHTVSLPRLPGHGTSWQELNRTTWHDWYAAVDAAFVELRSRCDRVVVGGLSMGGALSLRLAQQHGEEQQGRQPQRRGANEPAQIGYREEDAAQPRIEMLAGQDVHPRGTPDGQRGLRVA